MSKSIIHSFLEYDIILGNSKICKEFFNIFINHLLNQERILKLFSLQGSEADSEAKKDLERAQRVATDKAKLLARKKKLAALGTELEAVIS